MEQTGQGCDGMPEGMMDRRDGLELRLSLFLLLGALAGTIFCNAMGEETKSALGNMEESLVSVSMVQNLEFGELFGMVLRKRILWLLLGFLCALTSIPGPLFSCMAVYLGFSVSVLVCAMTMNTGLAAIFQYGLFVFPQCVFYVPAMYLLTIWMPGQGLALKWKPALFLLGLTLLGAAAESFLNPWVLALL